MTHLGNYKNSEGWSERILVGKVIGDKNREAKARS